MEQNEAKKQVIFLMDLKIIANDMHQVYEQMNLILTENEASLRD